MTREEIERAQKELAQLSEPHVRERFNASYIDCAPKNGELPSPRAVQAFLAIWKVLWRWKQNAKPGKTPAVRDTSENSPS